MIEQCYEKLAYLLYYDLLKLIVEIFDLCQALYKHEMLELT